MAFPASPGEVVALLSPRVSLLPARLIASEATRDTVYVPKNRYVHRGVIRGVMQFVMDYVIEHVQPRGGRKWRLEYTYVYGNGPIKDAACTARKLVCIGNDSFLICDEWGQMMQRVLFPRAPHDSPKYLLRARSKTVLCWGENFHDVQRLDVETGKMTRSAFQCDDTLQLKRIKLDSLPLYPYRHYLP